ncbi:tyrosine phosphatase PTPLA [Tubulinosema ratisbonensis]|uniref:Very-long-chain (3R)-3-hydroxyacyl-CoA dehydratase n=1 Tax=Tubulinosema ratisbonensis TaxID=291195 RepID=A0A437AII9_9MICR|nr:tyrosine phosphatase PTPLA [Tubulinosema ratisbonensis]
MILSKYQLFFNLFGVGVILYGSVNAILYHYLREIKYLKTVAYTQTFFLIEIFNIMIGATRSTYPATIIQVTSRLLVSWAVAYSHKHHNIWLTLLFIIWNISDLIRYLFYISRGKILKVLRYNAFLALYPIGIFLELVQINIAYSAHKGFIGYGFVIIMILYLPLFPFLYTHMINQRKRSAKISEMNKKKK